MAGITTQELKNRAINLKNAIKYYMKKHHKGEIKYRDWYVGIAQNEERRQERYKAHQKKYYPNYKAARPELKYYVYWTKSPKVIKVVEHFFTKKKNTHGDTGGVEKPTIIYVFKVK